MSIIIQDCEVPQTCAVCERRRNCSERIYMKTRPDHCPIIAMPEECLECVRTKFRAAVKRGEWAKMNAVLNGQDYDVKCPFYWKFRAQTGEQDEQTD